MKCKNCGAILPDNSNARFCRHCGAELNADDSAKAAAVSNGDTQTRSLGDKETESDTDSKAKGSNTGLVVSVALCIILFIAVGIFLFPKPPFTSDSSSHSGSVNTSAGAGGTTSQTSEGKGSGTPVKSVDINIANLVNGGHMAGDGNGNLYYASPVDGTEWDTKSIVKCSMNGSEKKTIYTAPSSTVNVYHINLSNNKLIFNQVIEKNQSTVVGVDLSSGRSYTIDTCDDWSLCQVVGDVVYYLQQGRIYRCDLEGRQKTAMAVVGENTKWRILNNKVYTFASESAEVIYKSNLDGSGAEAIYRESDGYTVRNAFPVEQGDGTIVLAVLEGADGKDDLVRLVRENGSVKSLTSAASITRICAYGNGIILTKASSSGRYTVGSINFSGATICADTEVPYTGETRFTCFVNDKILFGVLNNNCSVHSFEPSSGSFVTIAD